MIYLIEFGEYEYRGIGYLIEGDNHYGEKEAIEAVIKVYYAKCNKRSSLKKSWSDSYIPGPPPVRPPERPKGLPRREYANWPEVIKYNELCNKEHERYSDWMKLWYAANPEPSLEEDFRVAGFKAIDTNDHDNCQIIHAESDFMY